MGVGNAQSSGPDSEAPPGGLPDCRGSNLVSFKGLLLKGSIKDLQGFLKRSLKGSIKDLKGFSKRFF